MNYEYEWTFMLITWNTDTQKETLKGVSFLVIFSSEPYLYNMSLKMTVFSYFHDAISLLVPVVMSL